MKLLEGYKFKVEFDVENIPDLIMYETEPIGNGDGPNPVMLLANGWSFYQFKFNLLFA